jgi:hypothetical protein
MYNECWDEVTILEVYMGKSQFDDVFGGVGKVGRTEAAEDVGFQASYPMLHMLMTAMVEGDGKPRQVCTLNIVCEDGQFKAGLRERDRGLSLWTSCQTLGGVFAALEEAINERPPRWRKVDAKWGTKKG